MEAFRTAFFSKFGLDPLQYVTLPSRLRRNAQVLPAKLPRVVLSLLGQAAARGDRLQAQRRDGVPTLRCGLQLSLPPARLPGLGAPLQDDGRARAALGVLAQGHAGERLDTGQGRQARAFLGASLQRGRGRQASGLHGADHGCQDRASARSDPLQVRALPVSLACFFELASPRTWWANRALSRRC